MRSRARYRQIAVHYAFCLKGNRKEAVASTTVSTEGPEMTLSEDTNPFISLAALIGYPISIPKVRMLIPFVLG
jgi:hypothetical protein